jgi:uncharacterized protein
MLLLRRIMRAGWAAAMLLTAATVLPLDELYQGRAFVTGQDEADRGRGFALCLEEVLVKVSGDPSLTEDARLMALKEQAARFVAAFSYRDRMAGLPTHDEQGTRERPYDLFVTFDRGDIDAALRSLGREPWLTARPLVVVVLGVEDAQSRYVLTSDGERGLGQRQALAAAATERGLPLLVPSTSASKALTFSDAAAGTVAAKALGGDVALTGTLVWAENLLGWVAEWRLVWRSTTYRWRVDGVSFDDAFRNAVDGAERILSDRAAQ